MSEPRYAVDGAGISHAFPPGRDAPRLLSDFADWLRGRPWGSVGCFDLSGSFSDDAPIVDGPPLRREFALFLHLPDGGKAGFWYPLGTSDESAPVVGLGSEGEAAILGPSLEGFLAKLALGHFDDGRSWSDFAPREGAADATQELAAWLRDHAGLTDLEALAETGSELPDFEARTEAWTIERESYWADHAILRAVAQQLDTHRPKGGAAWDRTWFRVAIVGGLCELQVLRAGPQPVPEAAAVEPLLRALRDRQALDDPELGLWFGAELQLGADGTILPRFDYQTRPVIAGAPAPIDEARADLDRVPRPERWVPDWLRPGATSSWDSSPPFAQEGEDALPVQLIADRRAVVTARQVEAAGIRHQGGERRA